MNTSLELQTLEMLKHPMPLFVMLNNELHKFIATGGSRPELIRMNRSLRAPFIRELVRMGLPAADAVIEPVLIDGIPLLFNISKEAEVYISLSNRSIQQYQDL
jgi:hypothetical protein